jgi:hypothetical protein
MFTVLEMRATPPENVSRVVVPRSPSPIRSSNKFDDRLRIFCAATPPISDETPRLANH